MKIRYSLNFPPSRAFVGWHEAANALSIRRANGDGSENGSCIGDKFFDKHDKSWRFRCNCIGIEDATFESAEFCNCNENEFVIKSGSLSLESSGAAQMELFWIASQCNFHMHAHDTTKLNNYYFVVIFSTTLPKSSELHTVAWAFTIHLCCKCMRSSFILHTKPIRYIVRVSQVCMYFSCVDAHWKKTTHLARHFSHIWLQMICYLQVFRIW